MQKTASDTLYGLWNIDLMANNETDSFVVARPLQQQAPTAAVQSASQL